VGLTARRTKIIDNWQLLIINDLRGQAKGEALNDINLLFQQ
jgi:hypothetical protein